MKHARERETECADRDRRGDMQRRSTRLGAQPKMLIADMCGEHDKTGEPRRKPPRAQVVARLRKQSADDEISDAEEKGRWNPLRAASHSTFATASRNARSAEWSTCGLTPPGLGFQGGISTQSGPIAEAGVPPAAMASSYPGGPSRNASPR